MSPKDSEGGHRDQIRAVRDALASGLIGHEVLIERLLIAALAGGHVLIEGAPGLAKTRAVTWLARAVHGSFARVQCTPDLMPADLTGTAVFRPDTGGFEFVRGPVFHNIVLVDEINRAMFDVLQASMQEDPKNVKRAVHMLSASRHLERIADLATNIAEDVVFMVDGEVVRHQPEHYDD